MQLVAILPELENEAASVTLFLIYWNKIQNSGVELYWGICKINDFTLYFGGVMYNQSRPIIDNIRYTGNGAVTRSFRQRKQAHILMRTQIKYLTHALQIQIRSYSKTNYKLQLSSNVSRVQNNGII